MNTSIKEQSMSGCLRSPKWVLHPKISATDFPREVLTDSGWSFLTPGLQDADK